MPDTATGKILLEVARTLRPRILAERDHIEASRRLPADLAQELARAGFFRIFLPEAYGGLDLTPMAAMEVLGELARADASVAWCVWNGNTHWTTAQLAAEVAVSSAVQAVDLLYTAAGASALFTSCPLERAF